MVVVSMTLATICFMNTCYPALVGADTPKGTFQLTHVRTNQNGYGGDVLQFKETPVERFAIHRVWLLNPEERRQQRLASKVTADRVVTKGCVNVTPEVYEKLRKCCSKDKLLIK